MYRIFEVFTPEVRRAGYEWFIGLKHSNRERGWRNAPDGFYSVCPIGACLHQLGANDNQLLVVSTGDLRPYAVVPEEYQSSVTMFIEDNDGGKIGNLQEAMGA